MPNQITQCKGIREKEVPKDNKRHFPSCETQIVGHERESNGEPDFGVILDGFELVKKAKEKLLTYEVVYESVSPYTLSKMNLFYERIGKAIFETYGKPKSMEINLDSFSTFDDVHHFVFETILDYTRIANEFSKVGELISDLVNIRKELFLKVV